MVSRETLDRSLPDIDVSRRQALRGLVGGGTTVGAAMAIDNVLVGYGTLVGTNLVEQAASGALASLFDEGLRPRRRTRTSVGRYTVTALLGALRLEEGDTELDVRPLEAATEDWAADHGLPAELQALVGDLGAIAREEHTFEFHETGSFFDRVAGAQTRPLAVGAHRRWPATEPRYVEAFTDTDPADPRAVLEGLVSGFREHTYYDAPRYVAGSVQDNVIFGAVDLRAPFRNPVDFEALVADGETGLFCYEFTHRSLEALHAVSPLAQTAPVLGARVWDQRHKHVYTAVASIIREDDGLVVPVTFVDYTHTTLYDDFNLRGLLGEGFEAYNERHRASVVHWSPYG